MFLLVCTLASTWGFTLLLHILIHLPTINQPYYILIMFYPTSTMSFPLVVIPAHFLNQDQNSLLVPLGHLHQALYPKQLAPLNARQYKTYQDPVKYPQIPDPHPDRNWQKFLKCLSTHWIEKVKKKKNPSVKIQIKNPDPENSLRRVQIKVGNTRCQTQVQQYLKLVIYSLTTTHLIFYQ